MTEANHSFLAFPVSQQQQQQQQQQTQYTGKIAPSCEGGVLSYSEQNTCRICGKKFSWRSSLSRHMMKHNNVKPFSCGVCNKTFIQKSDLKRHLLTHTTPANRFSCYVCKKRFLTKEDLDRHSSKHFNLTTEQQINPVPHCRA